MNKDKPYTIIGNRYTKCKHFQISIAHPSSPNTIFFTFDPSSGPISQEFNSNTTTGVLPDPIMRIPGLTDNFKAASNVEKGRMVPQKTFNLRLGIFVESGAASFFGSTLNER